MEEQYVPGTSGYLDNLNNSSPIVAYQENQQRVKEINEDPEKFQESKEIRDRAEDEIYRTRAENAKRLFELERANAVEIQKQKQESSNQESTNQANLERIQLQAAERVNELIKKKKEEIRIAEDAAFMAYLEKQGKSLSTATEQEIADAQRVANEKVKAQKEAIEDTTALEREAQEELAKEAKARAKEAQESDKQKERDEAAKKKKDQEEAREELYKSIFTGTLVERFQGISQAFHTQDEETGEEKFDLKNGLVSLGLAISDLAKKMEADVDEISSHKSSIDTRLYGSKENVNYLGSHYDSIISEYTKAAAISGYVQQADILSSLETLVAKGIAHNVDQRAFLDTLKDKIATTFDVADSTLLRLVRIQQQDTTAGRLGMEAALNSFLNNMYETTEYLTDVAASVRSSLEEMESLMTAAQATEIEFEVQKWMGSLYSVGMSQSSVQAIADAIGKTAAGDISAITSGGAGNLVVMAANEAGISIADILKDGLDADQTNELLSAMVSYLAEIAESSSDSRVVAQQMADVYGLNASDLIAAVNLANETTMNSISSTSMSYSNMLNELSTMTDSIKYRTSVGEIMTNIWENSQYTLAASMASSPISYLTYKAASLLDSTVGGIAIPFVSAMGFGVDLETTVSDLMRVASMVVPIGKSLASAISGLGSLISPSLMLSAVGIDTSGGESSIKTIERGTSTSAVDKATSGTTTSYSGLVSNSNSDDMINATMAGAEDTVNEKTVEAVESEDIDILNKVIDEHVLNIYDLLSDVIDGSQYLNVKVYKMDELTGYVKSVATATTNISTATTAISAATTNNSSSSNSNSTSTTNITTGNTTNSTVISTTVSSGDNNNYSSDTSYTSNNNNSDYVTNNGSTSSSGSTDVSFNETAWSSTGNTTGDYFILNY